MNVSCSCQSYLFVLISNYYAAAGCLLSPWHSISNYNTSLVYVGLETICVCFDDVSQRDASTSRMENDCGDKEAGHRYHGTVSMTLELPCK